MLKKEAAAKIATLLKIKESDLLAAITATDEQDIEIPELTTFTTDELATRDTATGTTKYNEGKKAGTEMLIKDLKEKHSIEIDSKDPEKFIDALTQKVLKEAKIEPNTKIQSLEADNQKLRESITGFETVKQDYESKLNSVKLEKDLTMMLPKNLNPIITPELALTALKGKYEFVTEDGKQVVKKGGEILKDSKLLTPLSWNDVIKSDFTENKWLTEEAGAGAGGRGGVNDFGKGNVYLNLSSFKAAWESTGKSTMGEEYGAAVMAAKEANPSFDMNT